MATAPLVTQLADPAHEKRGTCVMLVGAFIALAGAAMCILGDVYNDYTLLTVGIATVCSLAGVILFGNCFVGLFCRTCVQRRQ